MIFVCGVTGLRQNVLERMLVIRQSVKGLPQKLCSAKVQTPATLHVCMYVHMNVHVHVCIWDPMYMLYECMYVMYVM